MAIEESWTVDPDARPTESSGPSGEEPAGLHFRGSLREAGAGFRDTDDEREFEPDWRCSSRGRDERRARRQRTPNGPRSIIETTSRGLECEPGVGRHVKRASRSIIHPRVLALVALSGAILFFAYDIVADWLYEDEYGTVHFFLELIVFVGVSMALVIGVRDLRRLRYRLNREERRNKLLSTVLAKGISERMDEWRMTRSEKDVAWFIIKGYRFSEIAEARGVKESTARLQATSLYAKAGVSGRAEFVAEILQPMLMSVPNDSSARTRRGPAAKEPH